MYEPLVSETSLTSYTSILDSACMCEGQIPTKTAASPHLGSTLRTSCSTKLVHSCWASEEHSNLIRCASHLAED
jgi:hypothetical protein